ncbi:hypothetical protein HMI54_002141 [Coelomomyces lativittatus]|nr:hypothetical protein HMI56_006777 [Coelomomyces lativittatus]KAJ1509743.1 hypothetical protein HMI54_002141 [Coelomomyces lativittatus]
MDFGNPSISPYSLGVSHNDGSFSLVDVNTGTTKQVIQAHLYETWCIHQGVTSPDGVWYTGGDEGVWKGWDVRQGERHGECHVVSLPQYVKHQNVGITCLVKHPTQQEVQEEEEDQHSSSNGGHVLVVGSYDGSLTWWDMRYLKSELYQLFTVGKGGVWKFKWHPSLPWLAIAAMQEGCQLFECTKWQAPSSTTTNTNTTTTLTPSLIYKEHQSMVYGVEWGVGKEGGKGTHLELVTCSFYDRQVHHWQVGSGKEEDPHPVEDPPVRKS